MPGLPQYRTVAAPLLFLVLWGVGGAVAQDNLVKWTTWTAIQAVPSPGFTVDHADEGTSLTGELRWQVVPINYSFNANRLVSPAQFFLVNPLRRHSGSVEAFVEPAWTLQPMRHSGDGRFGTGYGVRMFLPLSEYGENLSFSVAAKYLVREDAGGGNAGAGGVELGVYALLGIVGARLDLTTDPSHRASFSIVFKYY